MKRLHLSNGLFVPIGVTNILAKVCTATLPGRKSQAGSSMVEVLVSLSVVIIVFTVAVSGLRDIVAAVHREGAANSLLFATRLAQSEAIARNGRVILCKSADGYTCTLGGGWEQGWLVFQDLDANGRFDSGEFLVARQGALNATVRATGNTNIANRLAFSATGRPAQIGTFIVCTKELAAARASKIVIDIVGRPRLAQAQISACS